MLIIYIYIYIQSDQNVSVHLMITIQKSGAQRIFDRPVYIYIYIYVCVCVCVFPPWFDSPQWPRTPRYRGFTITLSHTALGKIHLDERSSRRRGIYLTTHNTHKR